ncbi:MAG: transglycosylase SLT domain-containing protein [Alphaproteobacteria bacterium]|nr:transglycosylase SLT domain-containing protein [Alphaproteobacteria bacterium]
MASLMRRSSGALIAGCIALSVIVTPKATFAASAAAPFSLDQWQTFIAEASHKFGIPQSWIKAVMQAESGGDPLALSPKGAMGLMQIMPGTWRDLSTSYSLGANPYDPRANVVAGTAYLSELYKRYGYPNLFAAYNAGSKRFDAYLIDRKPLPEETVRYLGRLGQQMFSTLRRPAATIANGLFFALHTGTGHPETPSSGVAPGSLFVTLHMAVQRQDSPKIRASDTPNSQRK